MKPPYHVDYDTDDAWIHDSENKYYSGPHSYRKAEIMANDLNLKYYRENGPLKDTLQRAVNVLSCISENGFEVDYESYKIANILNDAKALGIVPKKEK